MTEFTTETRAGRQVPPPSSRNKKSSSFLARGRYHLKRYTYLSLSIVSTVVGLALIVSFLAASYGSKVSFETERAIAQGETDGGSSAFLQEGAERLDAPHNEESIPDGSAPGELSTASAIVGGEQRPESSPPSAQSQSPTVNTPQSEQVQSPPAPSIDTSRPQETPTPGYTVRSASESSRETTQPTGQNDRDRGTSSDAPESSVIKSGETNSRGTTGRRITNVNLTFYDCASQGFCGAMANGRKVYEGAAACSYDLALGTKFIIIGDPTQRVYSCDDRGLLANTWVDVFWHSPTDGWKWQKEVGRYGTIEIIDTGTGR